MLSKEERNAIAERIVKEFDYTENDDLFSVDGYLHTELVSIADQLKELAGKDE